MKKPSCFCTIFTQVSLCFALYLALNLGQPIYSNRSDSRALDLYFISVKGGFRPLKQQTQLLKLVNPSFYLIQFFCFMNICYLICLMVFKVLWGWSFWFLFVGMAYLVLICWIVVNFEWAFGSKMINKLMSTSKSFDCASLATDSQQPTLTLLVSCLLYERFHIPEIILFSLSLGEWILIVCQ